MDSPLSRYLTRFSTEPCHEPQPDLEVFDLPELEAAEPEIDPVMLEHERRIEELRSEMTADHEARLAALEAEHEDALARALDEARARWLETQAAPLAERIGQAFETLGAELDERIADALLPLLSAAVVEKARVAVGDCLDRLLDDPAHPLVTLHGPAELIDAIRRERPQVRGLDYAANEEVDMRVTGSGLRIATQLTSALTALYAQTA